jgi:hypothetical protein
MGELRQDQVTSAVGWLKRHATEPRPARTGRSQPRPSLRTLETRFHTNSLAARTATTADATVSACTAHSAPPATPRYPPRSAVSTRQDRTLQKVWT